MSTDLRLAYGLNTDTIPAEARAVWGARLIWPTDLVHDRQDMVGESDDTKRTLSAWLNSGVLREALDTAGNLAAEHELRPSEDREVVLWGGYSHSKGVIVANPKASHGYLYVAAWLT